MSIGPHRELSSNIQRYKKFIAEVSNRLGEDYACVEELQSQQQSQQEHLQNSYSRSHRGSGHYNGKVKDSMIEQHYLARGESDSESEESSSYYDDEEACIPMNPPSSSHQSSNFLIPSHVKLNPRANLYLLIIFTCIITISSLVVGNGKSTIRSSSKHFSLFFSSISLLIATILGCGFRYAHMRIYITQPYFIFERFLGQGIDSREKATGIALLLSTVFVCCIVMQPQANLAVASNYHVLNSPLFYSTWVSVYTSVIVVADLFTLDVSRWIIARDCGGDCGVVPRSGCQPSFRSSALKTWSVALFSNFAMMFSACTAGLFEIYRTKIMVAGFLSLAGGFIGAGVLTLHHMVTTAQDRAYTYGTWTSWLEGPSSQKHLHRVGTVLSIIVLLLNCIIVGLICSPPSGPASIVLTCWVSLIVSILLSKKYIESFLVAQPQNMTRSNEMSSDSDRSKGTHTTAYESNSIEFSDDEEDGDMSAAYETDKRRSHDELMDRLKTLSVSAKFEQQESEEEIYTAVNQRPQQEPEEDVDSDLPDRSQDVQDDDSLTLSKIFSESSKIRSKKDPVESPVSVIDEEFKSSIKTNTVPLPPPYQNNRGNSGKAPPSPRQPPPPPFEGSQTESNSEEKRPVYVEPIESEDRNRKKASRNRKELRLRGKNPEAIDALVANALKHARRVKEMAEDQVSKSDDLSETDEESCIDEMLRKRRQHYRRRSSGVMSDGEESSESREAQRRACKVELAYLLKTIDSELRQPPQYLSHVFSSEKTRSHSSSEDRMPQPPIRTHRTKSKRQSLSCKSTGSRSE